MKTILRVIFLVPFVVWLALSVTYCYLIRDTTLTKIPHWWDRVGSWILKVTQEEE